MSDPFFEWLCKSVNKNWKIVAYLEINAKIILTVERTLLWIVTISLGKTGFRRSSFFAGPGLFFLQKQFYEKRQMI